MGTNAIEADQLSFGDLDLICLFWLNMALRLLSEAQTARETGGGGGNSRPAPFQIYDDPYGDLQDSVISTEPESPRVKQRRKQRRATKKATETYGTHDPVDPKFYRDPGPPPPERKAAPKSRPAKKGQALKRNPAEEKKKNKKKPEPKNPFAHLL